MNVAEDHRRAWLVAEEVLNARWMVSVKDTRFGAVGDGIVDDTDAIQAALDLGGYIYFPAGIYLTSAPLVVSVFGTSMIGAGSSNSQGKTTIKGGHTDGAVLRVKAGYFNFDGILIGATDARTAADAGLNFGIQQEREDEVGAFEPILNRYSRFTVTGQPNHAFYAAAGYMALEVSNFRISNNGGHGICVDDGTGSGRVNTLQAGCVNIREGRIMKNTGHGIKIGVPGSSVYRCQITNIDSSENALEAGVRDSVHNWNIHCTDTDVRLCGIAGSNAAGVATTGCLQIRGRNLRIINNRYLTPLAAEGAVKNSANDTAGVLVEDLHVFVTTLNPAVVITSTTHGNIEVRSRYMDNITSLVTSDKGVTRQEGRNTTNLGWVNARQFKSGDQRSIADDAVTTWEFTAATSGIVAVSGNVSGRLAGVFHFRVDTANNFCNVLAPASGVTGTTGALAGTTGVDGELTLSAHTDLKLYLENRTGGAGVYNLTVLSFGLTGQIRDAD